MLTNRTQSPTLPTTGLTATMDELDKTAQFWSAYQDTVKLFGPGTGSPGFELLMDPVLIGPAEHEIDNATTENVFDAFLSVVLKVTPVIIRD